MRLLRKKPLLALVALLAGIYASPARADVYPGGDWEQATPESQGIDGQKLLANLNALGVSLEPLMVVANGYSVLEIGDVSQEQYLWSCSKVVTAMLAGRLIHEGQIAGLDAIVPNTHPSHWYTYPGGGPFATFRQFMAMTSDYGLVPYLPNTHYAYNNNAVHFYGRYMGMEFFGTQEMHGPVRDGLLNLTGYDDTISFYGEWSGWGGGLRISTRDFARLGYLLIKGGEWSGQRVLDEEFANSLFACQIPPGADAAQGGGPINKYNQQHITDLLGGSWSFGLWDVDHWSAAAAEGYRGKKCLLIPDRDIVLVTLPHYDDEGPSSLEYYEAVMKSVIAHPRHDPWAVTATFDHDKTLPFLLKKGPAAVRDGAVKLGHPTRLLLPGRRYTDGTVLFTVEPDMAPASWVGALIRARTEDDESTTTNGTQTLVYLRRGTSTPAVRVEVLYHDSFGQPVHQAGPMLQHSTANDRLSVFVSYSGDNVRCRVNGEEALGIHGYSPVPDPPEGGYLSLSAHLSSGSTSVDYLMSRRQNGPRTDVHFEGGVAYLSIVDQDLLARFDPGSFYIHHGQSVWSSAAWRSRLIHILKPALIGVGADHLLIRSEGGFGLKVGEALGLQYGGYLEAEYAP